MRRLHHIALTFILTLGCLICVNTGYAANDPVSMLQSIANNMITGLKANKASLKTKPQVVYQLANKYIVPYAALNEMAKRVLPPQTWNQATPAQREQFQKEFTTTLVRTYASALTSYEDQVVHFFPIRGGNAKTIMVNSEVSGSNMQPIKVSYRLIHDGNNWKVYDLAVEGVSMLDSFRSQYADILSQANMSQLLKRMSSHNKRKG